jgi:hypothetical protein
MPRIHNLRQELTDRVTDFHQALEREGDQQSELFRKLRHLEDALGSGLDVSRDLTRKQMREAFELLLNRELPVPGETS